MWVMPGAIMVFYLVLGNSLYFRNNPSTIWFVAGIIHEEQHQQPDLQGSGLPPLLFQSKEGKELLNLKEGDKHYLYIIQ